MSLLFVKALNYQLPDKWLYRDANFTLNPKEHIGVTGKNGAGKTTLLRLLQNEITPDSGEICWQPNAKIGYLDQHAHIDHHLSIRDYLNTAFQALFDAERAMIEIYESPEKSMDESYLKQAAEWQTLLEKHQFYSLTHRIEQVAFGLGLDVYGLDTPIGNLSGGQRHKVMLAKLLLDEVSVLLLDEPTNYLDSVHIEWLTNYLRAYSGAFLVISHDIAFLDQITHGICDIEHCSIKKYKGNYSKAMAQKTLEQKNIVNAFDAQQKEIAKLKAFIAKNGAGVKAKIANGRKKQLTKMDIIEKPQHDVVISVQFAALHLNAQKIINTHELIIGYQNPLLPALNLHIQRGEKVVIAGFNGLGKSTLLKTLLGQLTPLSGNIELALGIKWGYFAQDLHWDYPESTPIQMVRSANASLNDKTARQQLSRFHLSGKKMEQSLLQLSGGEQTKVKLAMIAASPSNVLILDEPTTHLDTAMKAALKEALIAYSGTVVLVCHEVDFVEGWPDKVIDMSKLGSYNAV
ncbi:hypothetical protein Xmau_00604 [Xenorhabdus mauleonii]|uniref:ATPase components of ABC transporters with duplicated ATPase domains n=1 Tax=Xenorhabdus mauleonii TaxID=351675 RepID=A0A1I3JGN1_9GAMM|nr:ABC-F family ATP-binding cassette domain-containing protein [Xenorhabdus mauleonii]PHM46198.1 hypothetical protein Xmau_00604 [Xenorhabdus mauleonii]SFI59128.1 ATPase components of ABC transporters with duplicated ATPase domains [Xenorhabdus mauleonii]